MAEPATLKRYKIRATYTVDASVVGTSGPDALEKWRTQGPYQGGGPTPEAQAMLHLLEPKSKALARPEVTRMRKPR